LPSLPHDDDYELFQEFKKLNKEAAKFYKCSNGHLYTIGNCTEPAVTGKCPTCGGRDHQRNSSHLCPGHRPRRNAIAAATIPAVEGQVMEGEEDDIAVRSTFCIKDNLINSLGGVTNIGPPPNPRENPDYLLKLNLLNR
jgi:hypothetical protein